MFHKKKTLLGKDAHVEVSLTPLIDTLLVLLIVFMIATPFVYNAVKVTLPSGNVQDHRDTKDDIFIAIDQYGNLYGRRYQKITLTEIIRIIKETLIRTPHAAVVIFADKDALYGTVSEIVDVIKSSGVAYVYCKTKKIQP